MDKLFTVQEAAEKVGITPRQLRHWIDTGQISFLKIGGRIYLSETDFVEMERTKRTRNPQKDEIEIGEQK